MSGSGGSVAKLVDPRIIPDNEQQRLAELRRYDILDTPPDGTFDRITALLAKLLDVPIAIVSLVDSDRIWFKSHFGLDAQQIDREPGLCASAILGDLPYILPDAKIDPHALANPLVAGEFGLRFYAAVPLKTRDGYNLGTLCCIDFAPRTLTQEEVQIMETLAGVVMDEMELRLSARRIERLNRELLEAHEELKQQATRDALTGLWNRGAIMGQLEKALAMSKREQRAVFILILDLDYFKKINDECGHIAGDQVLVEVAHRLSSCCRDSDTIGRIGGEEFLAVMYPCTAEQALRAAERFRQAVAASPIASGPHCQQSLNVTISGGLFGNDGGREYSVREMMKYADDALYLSKSSGRNCISMTPPEAAA